MARKRSDEKAESAASESNHTGQLEEQEKRNKNQRRGFNKQNRQAEKRLAAAAQAATPLPQTTMLQEAHLLISDGGPGTAPTVPEVVDREPFHPTTPTANSSATTGLASNTHGDVRGSLLTRHVDGAENTAVGTATMTTTSGVTKPKRKAWKHTKPKKTVIEAEDERINPKECATAQPESSKNWTGPPRLEINNGKAKNPTQTLSNPPDSKAGPKADRSVKDSSTKLNLAGTKRKRERVLPPPTDAIVAGWQDFRPSTGGDTRMATGSGAVHLPQPTAEGPISKKRKGKGKNKGEGKDEGQEKGNGKNEGQEKGKGKTRSQEKGKGKDESREKGKGKNKSQEKGKGKDEGQGKGKGKGKEKEVAIKEAADTWADSQHLDEPQGSARLGSLPNSFPFPFTTLDQNHPHTHHHSTPPDTGEPPTIVEESESLVPTQDNMPASTRGMITSGKP